MDAPHRTVNHEPQTAVMQQRGRRLRIALFVIAATACGEEQPRLISPARLEVHHTRGDTLAVISDSATLARTMSFLNERRHGYRAPFIIESAFPVLMRLVYDDSVITVGVHPDYLTRGIDRPRYRGISDDELRELAQLVGIPTGRIAY